MAEQLTRLPSRFRLPWVTKQATPPPPPANAENQASSNRSTNQIPTRRFSFQLPESVPPPQPLPPSGTEPPQSQPTASEPRSSSVIQIQSTSAEAPTKPSSPSYSPPQTSSKPPSPQKTSQLETIPPGIKSTTSPSEQPLESKPKLQEITQPQSPSRHQQHLLPPEPLSPLRQSSESQLIPKAISQQPIPSNEGSEQQQQKPTSSLPAEPPPSKQAPELKPKPQEISQPPLSSNDGSDQQQQSQTISQLPEPPSPPKQAPEQQPTPQVISHLPSPSTKESLKQQSQTTSLSPEPHLASEKGPPESQNTVQTISPPPAPSNAVSLQQHQSQTTSIPTESPPTPPQVISQSPSSSFPVEPLSGSTLSAPKFEPTSNETGYAQPALPKPQAEVSYEAISPPKDQTQMQANTNLEEVANQPSQLSDQGEIERLTSMKPGELLAPPQPSSPSHTDNQLARETPLRPTSPTSLPQLMTPALSHPSSPSKQASQVHTTGSQPSSPSMQASKLQTKSLTSSQPSSPSRQASQLQTKSLPQPSSPSREVSQPQQPSQTASKSSTPWKSSTYQSDPLSNETAQSQPSLPAVLPQDPEPKKQLSAEQQVSQALDQAQIQATINSGREKKEPSQTRSPATTVEPTPTAVSQTDSPARPLESSDVPTLVYEPPKSETKSKEIDGKLKTEPEPKTGDRLESPADEEPKQRTITKLLNFTSESNKHMEGQSGITTQAEKEQPEKQPNRNRNERAATAFQRNKGEAPLTGHPKKKIAGHESQPRSSVSQRELVSLNKEISEDFSRFIHKLALGHPHQSMDENSTNVIALCGINTGASMHLGPEKEQDVRASKTCINNNVQGINNSILYTSSISERTPGVHLAFSHKPIESVFLNTTLESIEESQKLKHMPAVEKECFRDLTAEFSASGAED